MSSEASGPLGAHHRSRRRALSSQGDRLHGPTRRRSTVRSNIGPVPQMVLPQETIRKRLQAVPDTPGVYLLRDDSGQVIYVGKALRLRDRLRSFFSTSHPQTARTAFPDTTV